MHGDTDSGWQFVAECDGAARLFDALLDLDPGETYSKTDLAEVTGVPLKTLYLEGLLDECVDLGVLERADGTEEGSEPRYAIDEDSDVLTAAAAFDDAFEAD